MKEQAEKINKKWNCIFGSDNFALNGLDDDLNEEGIKAIIEIRQSAYDRVLDSIDKGENTYDDFWEDDENYCQDRGDDLFYDALVDLGFSSILDDLQCWIKINDSDTDDDYYDYHDSLKNITKNQIAY